MKLILLVLSALFIFQTNAQGMLFPQRSESREVVDLSGIWRFKADFNNVGIDQRWYLGPLPLPTIDMPVPSSYNDITQDPSIRDHIGWVWYETEVWVPKSWSNQRIILRFESAHYNTMAWLNGGLVVTHSGGHLPFESDISSNVSFGKSHRLTVAVNNTLTPTTLPPGEIKISTGSDPYHPKGYVQQITYFDFFNYAGIHRPVKLYTTPKKQWIDDITITYDVTPFGDGVVNFDISVKPFSSGISLVSLYDGNNIIGNQTVLIGKFQIPSTQVKLWEPGNPYLYTLQITIGSGDDIDVYRLKSIGIRTIKVTSNRFLINNKPFYFHGVNKHEDSDIRGKGLDNVIVVKDFNMLKWMNVNSFRTSHYPYADEFYDQADKEGIVIIDEAPAVGLNVEIFFNNDTLSHHKQVISEIIRRDKNHPSVVMWSVANEPGTNFRDSIYYFKEIASYTRSIDPTKRPVTLINSVDYTSDNNVGVNFDVICVNRYYGWYTDTGHLELIQAQLTYDLNGWFSKYGKPVLVSEYGADTVPGIHEDPPVVFTEDFQVAFSEQYWAVFDKLRPQFLIGELVWNFADFRTGQAIIRVGSFNLKGVLTRQRNPKAAARALKNRYASLGS
eukprot:TRINITY_DN5425_c0_g1_i1.p1 TRINITY_DN5425_c0_g1~~TRINITY_DN5425_c0_g1_i1.p1  ORF type:complete len:614 (+),score=93.28 TRINITY_DN5425_c0_g1_i1:58-1899(+)